MFNSYSEHALNAYIIMMYAHISGSSKSENIEKYQENIKKAKIELEKRKKESN